jgi:hypothetical protein
MIVHPAAFGAGRAASPTWFRGAVAAALVLAVILMSGGIGAQEARTAFRPCIDPENLPFANIKGEGFENRIAELFARKLGLPVKNYAFPAADEFRPQHAAVQVARRGFSLRCRDERACGLRSGGGDVPLLPLDLRAGIPEGQGLDNVRSGADLIALPPNLRTGCGSAFMTNRRVRLGRKTWIGVAGQAVPDDVA